MKGIRPSFSSGERQEGPQTTARTRASSRVSGVVSVMVRFHYPGQPPAPRWNGTTGVPGAVRSRAGRPSTCPGCKNQCTASQARVEAKIPPRTGLCEVFRGNDPIIGIITRVIVSGRCKSPPTAFLLGRYSSDAVGASVASVMLFGRRSPSCSTPRPTPARSSPSTSAPAGQSTLGRSSGRRCSSASSAAWRSCCWCRPPVPWRMAGHPPAVEELEATYFACLLLRRPADARHRGGVGVLHRPRRQLDRPPHQRHRPRRQCRPRLPWISAPWASRRAASPARLGHGGRQLVLGRPRLGPVPAAALPGRVPLLPAARLDLPLFPAPVPLRPAQRRAGGTRRAGLRAVHRAGRPDGQGRAGGVGRGLHAQRHHGTARSLGLGQAVAVLVGRRLGEDRPDLAERRPGPASR